MPKKRIWVLDLRDLSRPAYMPEKPPSVPANLQTPPVDIPVPGLSFMAGGGEMGGRTRAFDWPATPVGPVAGWPQSLKMAVNICLRLPLPHCHLVGAPGLHDVLQRCLHSLSGSQETSRLAGTIRSGLLARDLADDWPDIGKRLRDGRGHLVRGPASPPGAKPAASEEARLDGIGHGADDYLTKPFSARELLARMSTNLKLAGIRHQAAEEILHYAAIVESSDDAILSKDLNGIIQSWNNGAQRIFGYTAQEIIGKSVTTLIPAKHQNEEPEILARIRRGQKVDHYETVRQRKDGSFVNISLTVSPIKDADGRVIGASKIARDITQQKRAEAAVQQARQELATLNEELEHRVKERTASLNEAVAQMEEFSYSVSHDLRGPVRAMQGYARVIDEDYGHLLDDAGREYLQRIIRGSTRMDKLILDVLVYSRLARTQVQLRPVSLDALVRDVIQHYPDMQSSRAQIAVAAPLGDVLAHESSLTQAVSNLLGNAMKFVPPGTVPRVEVSTERRGANVRLWIKDNGIGIRPEHQSRLFGMFERVDPHSRYEGTGIGLAIVRKALEKMNDYWLKTTRTTFS